MWFVSARFQGGGLVWFEGQSSALVYIPFYSWYKLVGILQRHEEMTLAHHA